EEIKRKVRDAVAYPAFVLTMGVATLFVVLFFVVPRLALIYADFQGRLPLLTSIVLKLSKAAPVLLGLFLAAITALGVTAAKNRAGAAAFVSEHVPFLRGLSLKLSLART